MKKLTWMFSVSLLITSTAYGSFLEMDEEAEFEDGFYAGLSLGANWTHGDWDGLSTISLIDNNSFPSNVIFDSWTPKGESTTSGKLQGNVALGYQLVGSRLYLAGEISGTFSEKRDLNLDDMRSFESTVVFFDTSVLTGTSHTQSKVSLGNSEFDIDLKPGILVLENFIVYARAGVAFTTLDIDNSGEWTETVSENDFVLTPSATSHNSKDVVGFRAGAGAQYLVTENLGITLDYIFTDYGTIKTRAEDTASPPSACTPFYVCLNQVYGVHAPEVKITTQTLMAGIVYHF